MSDLLNDLDLAPERETLREPPKRWRNKWRSDPPPSEATVEPDGSWLSNTVWPSEDVARSKAAQGIEETPPIARLLTKLEYVGPVRVNERGDPL